MPKKSMDERIAELVGNDPTLISIFKELQGKRRQITSGLDPWGQLTAFTHLLSETRGAEERHRRAIEEEPSRALGEALNLAAGSGGLNSSLLQALVSGVSRERTILRNMPVQYNISPATQAMLAKSEQQYQMHERDQAQKLQMGFQIGGLALGFLGALGGDTGLLGALGALGATQNPGDEIPYYLRRP